MSNEIYEIYTEKDREIIRDIRDSFAQKFTMQSYKEDSNRIIFVFKHYYLTHHIGVTCRGNALIIYSDKVFHVKRWTKKLSESIASLNIFLKMGSFDYLPHKGVVLFSLTAPLYGKPPPTFVFALLDYSLGTLDDFVFEIFAIANDLGLVEKVCDNNEDKNLNYFYR
jgi:hypothetical protein